MAALDSILLTYRFPMEQPGLTRQINATNSTNPLGDP